MKKLILLFIVFNTTIASAEIIRVNNNAGISADFSSLQTAIDSAIAGDTIYLEPSSTSYGNINLNKRLSIYGAGYFLSQNTGQQANVNTSKVDAFTFANGSAFSSISGLELQGTCHIYVGNIAITRCRFLTATTSIQFEGSGSNSNVLIAQNFIGGNFWNAFGTQTFTIFVRNNIIFGTSMNLDPTIVGEFTNNVMSWNTYVIYNSTFVNNVFRTGSTTWDPNNLSYNNGFENNIFVATPNNIDTALGNQVGVNQNSIFTFQGTSDGRFQIIPGGPADDTGKEIPSGTPTDIGAFGGPNPYKLSGVPAIPTIYDLVVPTSNTTGGLNVTIKAKSQD